jgi:cation diffusion facilitator CzcD-associated flavoprotein CzcO
MLDTPTQSGTQPASPRICIIGSGVSGLVAAKVMRERGHDVTVLERSGDIGGVWEPSRSYPGVKTQTPRDLYCFSDFPMPADYPEWPSGAQVHAYLDAYAKRFDLRSRIRLATEVLALARPDPLMPWTVTTRGAGGVERVESFDFVVVATGQFSLPRRLDAPGEAAFKAAGGVAIHSSEYVDDSIVARKRVVVVGFSKSATDVAMSALEAGAREVTLVHREVAWKIPYFFGGLVNFKNILYCRASEAMFMPWAPSPFGRLMRGLSKPLIWANWRALESLLDMQFGLKKLGLRPAEPIEETVHCSTSIETPGFYKAIKAGGIKTVQGTVSAFTASGIVVGASEIAADIVIQAIGWHQEFPFLDNATRDKLVASDGQYQLHHMIVNPDIPGLGFVGYNSSFATPLSSELGAHWLARYIEGGLARMPTREAMRAGIETQLAWKREKRRVALGYGGLCAAPFHHFHFDALMRDIGARLKGANPLATYFAPISPKAYGKLLATAPKLGPSAPRPINAKAPVA